MSQKGQHQRGYLPHRDYGSALQAITFREADSLPSHVIENWREELKDHLESPDEETQAATLKELSRRIAHYEDAGHGKCLLLQPEVAKIVQETLLAGHEVKYRLIAWCIMPNHVHVLIKQGDESPLGKIVQQWKGSSSRLINTALESKGSIWAKDYFDRVIRDDEHFWNCITYIHRNPVRAGLVKEPIDWPFSSVGHGWPLPTH